MSNLIRDLGSEVIVIDHYKGGKWGSKKRQIERNVMFERSQKLGILTGNAHTDLSKTSKIYSFINREIDHQKKCLDMLPLLGLGPGLSGRYPAIYQCVKEAVKQLSH